MKNLKPHKAAGPDDIPLMLLKKAADEIAPAITLLFQASLNQGNTPSTWRKALVVPIFKKGSKSDASNYRPISLTYVRSLQILWAHSSLNYPNSCCKPQNTIWCTTWLQKKKIMWHPSSSSLERLCQRTWR